MCSLKGRIQHGFTLVELLVAIVIIGILAAVGIPSFQRQIDNARLIGASDNILADVRFAQSESLKTNSTVRVTFDTAGWSYSIANTSTSTTIKSVSNADYKGLTLSMPTGGSLTITFDPKRSTITEAPATAGSEVKMISLTSSMGSSVSLTVDSNSRFRLCSSTATGSYVACP